MGHVLLHLEISSLFMRPGDKETGGQGDKSGLARARLMLLYLAMNPTLMFARVLFSDACERLQFNPLAHVQQCGPPPGPVGHISDDFVFFRVTRGHRYRGTRLGLLWVSLPCLVRAHLIF